MRSLVTGAAGFVGTHLVRHLREQGDSEIVAVVHPSDGGRNLSFGPRTRTVQCDILDDGALTRVLAEAKPDAVYHLAAFSNPEDSLRQARRTLETNLIGTQNLLEAARELDPGPRVLLVGSGQQYGTVSEDDQPIQEELPQRPLTPYAVSKAAQELLGQRYALSLEMPVYWTRSFNHTGPGQADNYVCSSFARQVVDVEKGRRSAEIRVGNLAARRDFTDVRDVARAYRAIVESGTPARAYNVCQGTAVSIQEVLDLLVRLSVADVAVSIDPERFHALDAPLMVGDSSRLRSETGWAPQYTLEQTLSDLLGFWREQE